MELYLHSPKKSNKTLKVLERINNKENDKTEKIKDDGS
jgi:hypothetical protein